MVKQEVLFLFKFVHKNKTRWSRKGSTWRRAEPFWFQRASNLSQGITKVLWFPRAWIMHLDLYLENVRWCHIRRFPVDFQLCGVTDSPGWRTQNSQPFEDRKNIFGSRVKPVDEPRSHSRNLRSFSCSCLYLPSVPMVRDGLHLLNVTPQHSHLRLSLQASQRALNPMGIA